MTAALGLAVYGAAVARSAFLGSAPIGIAAAVMAAVMSGKWGQATRSGGAATVSGCRREKAAISMWGHVALKLACNHMPYLILCLSICCCHC